MRLRWVLGFILTVWASSAEAAYVGAPPLVVGLVNGANQAIGAATAGQQTIPVFTAPLPTFPPAVQPAFTIPPLLPVPPFVATPPMIATDGFKAISITPPFKGAVPNQNALAVSISPNPAPQCPLIASVNITANATIITNPGGKFAHVCAVVLINGGTAQSVTLLEGTGTACATNPTYWLGGSGATAALAVSGGFSVPGNWINYPMQVRGDNVCVIVSGSTNVSGSITYGLYP